MGDASGKVGSAVDWVNYPGAVAYLATVFFPHECVAWEGREKPLSYKFLHFAIGGGEVVLGAFEFVDHVVAIKEATLLQCSCFSRYSGGYEEAILQGKCIESLRFMEGGGFYGILIHCNFRYG